MLLCTGCGAAAAGKGPNAADLTFNRKRGTIMAPENPAVESEEVETTKEDVFFGSERASGWKDFKYLTEEHLTTSKTKSKQEAEIPIYIPDGENIHASGASAKSERAGVSIKVDLEPYIQYKPEEYSVSSNLETYVEGEIDYYYESYFDIEVGEIEELNRNVSVCEMNFMKYDSMEETYAPYFVVYSLHKIDDDILALVVISIEAENTTKETKELLAELSSFYRIPIRWNTSFAEQKRAKFENTGQAVDGVFYLDCLSFELPEGWELDEEESGYGATFYAPDGDSENARTCLCIMEVMESFGLVDYFLEDLEETAEMFAYDENIRDFTAEDMGFTFLGRTVRFEMTEYTEEGVYRVIIFYAEDDKNQYAMIASYVLVEETGEEETEAEAETQEALEKFFETGSVRNVL